MSLKLVEKTRQTASDRKVAVPTLEHENEDTVVWRFKLRPGEQTGWHRHENDYLTVQLSHGRLHLDFADGSAMDIDYKPGATRYIEAPVEHNAYNAGDVDIEVLEIEYKTRRKG